VFQADILSTSNALTPLAARTARPAPVWPRREATEKICPAMADQRLQGPRSMLELAPGVTHHHARVGYLRFLVVHRIDAQAQKYTNLSK